MSPLVGATDPSPSCSVPRVVLHTTASLGVSHWTEKAAARGPPEARLIRSGTSTSPVAAGPVHSITRVLHRVVAVGRPTGRSLPACDEPSTPGCGSSVLPTPEHRRTPETAGQSVVLHAPVKVRSIGLRII